MCGGKQGEEVVSEGSGEGRRAKAGRGRPQRWVRGRGWTLPRPPRPLDCGGGGTYTWAGTSHRQVGLRGRLHRRKGGGAGTMMGGHGVRWAGPPATGQRPAASHAWRPWTDPLPKSVALPECLASGDRQTNGALRHTAAAAVVCHSTALPCLYFVSLLCEFLGLTLPPTSL